MSLIFSKLDIASNHLSNIEEIIGPVKHAQFDPKTVDESELPNKYKLTKWCILSKYEQFADRIQNFKIRPDDVWLVGFYKTGTTWVHNIIWQLKNNLDFSAPTIGYGHNVFPMFHSMAQAGQFEYFDEMPSPRIFKTHLPASLLPKQLWTVRPKIIYTSRNPKDAAVSLYHFIKPIDNCFLTKEDVFNAFLNEFSPWSPFHAHVLSFFELRNFDHVLFCRYEDLLADQFNNIQRISTFLNCTFSDQDITDLIEHVSFRKMREKIPMDSVIGIKLKKSPEHKFCQKGMAGDYRNEMSEEFIKRFDEWSADRLKDVDFKFANV